MADESITIWLKGIKSGDDKAAHQIWEKYFHRLVGVGRRIISKAHGITSDEEDVALSAFKSFCLRAREDRFPKLEDREDLWKILLTITLRKAFRNNRRTNMPMNNEQQFALEQLCAEQTAEETAFMIEEQLEHLLQRIDDPRIKELVLAKLDGKTNQEIAKQLNKSVSFVERKLQLLRQQWNYLQFEEA
ncbi:MAG: ECF-type sigma factor [Zavarzinella sp.]